MIGRGSLRPELERIANAVADRLLAEGKAGKRQKIGYDDIRVALLAEDIPQHLFNQVAERALRLLVERCG